VTYTNIRERAKVQNKSQWDKKFTENYNSIEMR